MIYFTADEHYGHTNIIKFCNRPFKDVLDMNEQLIQRHNDVVKPFDTIYHIGDFSLKIAPEKVPVIIARLNGYHYFITGSHDRWINKSTSEGMHHKVLGPIWEGVIDNRHVFLSHYPHLSWPRSYHGSLHFHGHTHGKVAHGRNRYDVGVDVNSFAPISLEAIVKYLLDHDLLHKGVGI